MLRTLGELNGQAASEGGETADPVAPAKLTAEFLDALGSRLSSVRDLLTAPHEPGNAPGTG